MRILLSNDDGVHSPGLQALYEGLAGLGDLEVVAPDRDHSGASNALTLNRPLTVEDHPNGFRSVDGTPTDCVHLGVNGLFDEPFDRVVSGINTHANLGDDIIYSGTVAAATEGRNLGLPAIAVSLVNEGRFHYETAARVVRVLLESKDPLALGPRCILNVNVPDVPWEEIAGFRVTRLGHRDRAEGAVPMTCPRGKARYWIGAAGEGSDAGPGTDFNAVRENYVSITPVHVDMTRHEVLSPLREWVGLLSEREGALMVAELDGIGMTSRRTRMRLIQRLREAGIADEQVLQAMSDTPRHIFLDEALAHRAYEDTSLPIGYSQTLSQPYIVARMTESLMRHKPRKVLELGTGSGYQTAILARLVDQVFSVERIKPLQDRARDRLRQLGLRNVMLKHADGGMGWPDQGPFDGIIVTAAPREIPSELKDQLADGGVIVAPIGEGTQMLVEVVRHGDRFETTDIEPVRFVPLLGGVVR